MFSPRWGRGWLSLVPGWLSPVAGRTSLVPRWRSAGLAPNLAGRVPALADRLTVPDPAPVRLVNGIQISVNGRIRPGSVYNVVVRGSARERATASLFVDYFGCARSLSAERRRTGGQSDAYIVQGTFVEVSGWTSSSRGTDHACAYLVTARGHLLATARRSYRVG